MDNPDQEPLLQALGWATVPLWDGRLENALSIAQYILENDDFVNDIVSRAGNELLRTTNNHFHTFAHAEQAARAASKPNLRRNIRRAEAKALYLHIKNDYELRFEYERHFREPDIGQVVRLPAYVRRENRGTCIDLAVLYLSCLANAKLKPLYIHVDDGEVAHALAGVWIDPLPDDDRKPFVDRVKDRPEILVVDCTGFARGFSPQRPHKLSFKQAKREAVECIGGSVGRFQFAVDIVAAWRSGVQPLGPPTRLLPADVRLIESLGYATARTEIPKLVALYGTEPVMDQLEVEFASRLDLTMQALMCFAMGHVRGERSRRFLQSVVANDDYHEYVRKIAEAALEPLA